MSEISQVKVTLPKRVKESLDTKANNLGLATSVYIRHLIIKDIEDLDFPTFQASELTEKSIKEGVGEYKQDKTKKFRTSQELIKSLQ